MRLFALSFAIFLALAASGAGLAGETRADIAPDAEGHLVQPGFVEDLAAGPWRFWRDAAAKWRDDPLYLPEDVKLSALPVNSPTGGWPVLSGNAGRAVSLPASVEQYEGDHLGQTPVTGVAWFWRAFDAPAVPKGERLVIRFRGARLRAEVYVNGKLCGYNILTELPFLADITDAVRPGAANQVAVRITNPGGNMAWGDWGTFSWGAHVLPLSRGIGGLDAGIELMLRGSPEITDLYAGNTPDLHRVVLTAETAGPGVSTVAFSIQREGRTVWSGEAPVTASPTGPATATVSAVVSDAVAWDLRHPNLYIAVAELPGQPDSGRRTAFGFRWFNADGIGTDAVLRLNGRRIVVRSAISWGWWGGSGLWPTPDLARKEIADAQTFGLNCLQAHRNLAKENVLELQDKLGLLRYEEPGSGQNVWEGKGPVEQGIGDDAVTQPPIDTTGRGGAPSTFTQRYEFDKIMAMVRRDRSHPSLIVWCMQNENATSLHNPRKFYLLHAVHALDPHRLLVLKSGPSHWWNEAFMLPDDDKVYAEDGHKYCGWHDEHDSVDGPGMWTDSLYKSPTDYEDYSSNRAEIAMWGEVTGAPAPDDHTAIVKELGGASAYDSEQHRRMARAYDDFLDRWKFRGAFPDTSALFQAIGRKEYDSWQRRTELARVNNFIDYFVTSGWESTAIDNFSGLVDAYRNFKADPAIIAQANEPERIVIEPRRSILEPGQGTLLDVFLINETGRKGPHRLDIGAGQARASYQVNVTGGETYGQLLQEAIPITAPAQGGDLHVLATLTPTDHSAPALTRDFVLRVVAHGDNPTAPVALAGRDTADVAAALLECVHVQPVDAARAKVCLVADDGGPGAGAPDLEGLLSRVQKEGLRLVYWPEHLEGTDRFVRALDRHGVLHRQSVQPGNSTGWMGCWYFVRKHWLFDGLPVDCGLDDRYQIVSTKDCGGFDVSGDHLDVMLGFDAHGSAEVHPTVGGFVAAYGRGEIVVLSLPHLRSALMKSDDDIARPVARRLLLNALFGGTR